MSNAEAATPHTSTLFSLHTYIVSREALQPIVY